MNSRPSVEWMQLFTAALAGVAGEAAVGQGQSRSVELVKRAEAIADTATRIVLDERWPAREGASPVRP